MSESTAPHFSPSLGQKSPARIGGALGIAAASISLLIFTVGCFGLDAVFKGPPIIPLLLSIPGMILTIVGGTVKKSGEEDTQIFMGLFVNLLGLVGAILEIAIWQNWNIFYTAPVGG
jgi:hypothetical protein